MKLDEVPGGAIYVDTNIFYMYLRADPAHLHLVGVETLDFDGMLDNIKTYTLLPRDAYTWLLSNVWD
jgi:hypothetical protein